jgi:hypothetical protein
VVRTSPKRFEEIVNLIRNVRSVEIEPKEREVVVAG